MPGMSRVDMQENQAEGEGPKKSRSLQVGRLKAIEEENSIEQARRPTSDLFPSSHCIVSLEIK